MGSFSQILKELQTMIANTDDKLRNCVFNSNHASNCLSLKGKLGRDKGKFLHAIDRALEYAKLHQLDRLTAK